MAILLGLMSCNPPTESHLERDRKSQDHPHGSSQSNKGLKEMKANQAEFQAISIDHDFIHLMVSQQGLILEIARQELDRGNKSLLRPLAQRIITEHQAEKIFWETAAARLEHGERIKHVNSPLHGKIKKALGQMRQQMSSKRKAADPGSLFRDLIVIHHQASITIAQDYLLLGHDQAMKSHAQDLISQYKKEIQELQNSL